MSCRTRDCLTSAWIASFVTSLFLASANAAFTQPNETLIDPFEKIYGTVQDVTFEGFMLVELEGSETGQLTRIRQINLKPSIGLLATIVFQRRIKCAVVYETEHHIGGMCSVLLRSEKYPKSKWQDEFDRLEDGEVFATRASNPSIKNVISLGSIYDQYQCTEYDRTNLPISQEPGYERLRELCDQ